jgi:hypothetical protein
MLQSKKIGFIQDLNTFGKQKNIAFDAYWSVPKFRN